MTKMNINDAVEMSSRGYGNTMNNAQKVLVDAYIQCVLEENYGYEKTMVLTELFEQILNEL